MQLDPIKNKKLGASLRELSGIKKLAEAAGRPVQRATIPGVVYLLIDTSGSMSDSLDEAKRGARSFAEQAQRVGHAVGLIGFDTVASHFTNPQAELAQLVPAISALAIGGSTNLTSAIDLATNKLLEQRDERVIYIVTDGMPDDPSSALQSAERAKKRGIKIMTLGTAGADRAYLAKLSSRPEMSIKVQRAELREGITSMAKLLGN